MFKLGDGLVLPRIEGPGRNNVDEQLCIRIETIDNSKFFSSSF